MRHPGAGDGDDEAGPGRRLPEDAAGRVPAPAAALEREMAVSRLLRRTVEASVRLAAAADPVAAAAVATAVLVDDFGAARAELWLVGPGRGLRLAAAAGRPSDALAPPPLVADVAATGLPVVTGAPVGPFGPELAAGPPPTAAAVLPLTGPGPEGDIAAGVLAAWFTGPVPLEVADVVAAFATVVAAALAASEAPAAPPGRAPVLLDALPVVVWEADAATMRFGYVSRWAEQLLGYPLERWTEPGFWAAHLHPDDRAYALATCAVAAAEGGDHDVECRMATADGREVWLRTIVRSVPGDPGGPPRLGGVMIDVTEAKRAEQAVLESRARFASLARTLQASLLPPHLPDIAGLEVASAFRPAEEGVEVVGDFYDLFDVGGGAWGVVIGDVCGKGADAASLTALARYTVRAAAIRERRPSRVLRVLNDAVLRDTEDERFCTAAYARLELHAAGAAVAVTSGGHPLPLVLRAGGGVERAGRPGTLLGMFPDPDLADDTVELGPGDALVLFTDGAVEARRGGELLGEQRFAALVGTCAHLRGDEIAARLLDGVVAFGAGDRMDDLAIVVLRVRP